MKKYLHEIRVENSVIKKNSYEILRKFNNEFEAKKPIDYYSNKQTEEEKTIDRMEQYTEHSNDGLVELKNAYKTFIVDLSLFLLEFNEPIKVLNKIHVDVSENSNAVVNIAEYIDRLEKVHEKISNSFNDKVNVHIGGSLLLNINKTKLLEDACTDLLQGELDKGWRIVACCVQPDGRRPDYILGRYEFEDK